jgi:peroxiredoxin
MVTGAQQFARQPGALRTGGRTPLFVLPQTSGGRSGPAAARSKYNLVLAFVPSDPAGEAYLRDLAASHPDIIERDARVMAVVPLALDGARELASRLELPFSLLADEDGATAARHLGEGNRAALCVADRYGSIYSLDLAPDASALPPVQTALDWLDFMQIQCPE